MAKAQAAQTKEIKNATRAQDAPKATSSVPSADVNLKLLFGILEGILNRAASTFLGKDQATHGQHDALGNNVQTLLQPHITLIRKISREITCKCLDGKDVASTAVELGQRVLPKLSSYSWQAKIVIPVAAFAVNTGKYLLAYQLRSTNPVAKSVAIFEHLIADTVKTEFTELIRTMLDVTKCIVEINELQSEYKIAAGAKIENNIKIYVDWTIQSIVACTSQIMGNEESQAAAKDVLSNFTNKGREIHRELSGSIDQAIKEEYEKLAKGINNHSGSDNFAILIALIKGKVDQQPLCHGPTKQRESIDKLRGKTVFLVISDLELSEEDLWVLKGVYQQSHDKGQGKSEKEIVWLPVVDRWAQWSNEEIKKQFDSLRERMPWYSLNDPWFLSPAVNMYIEKEWKFQQHPLLVVVDKSEKPWITVHININMFWIAWFRIPINPVDTTISTIRFLINITTLRELFWDRKGNYICLYGGEDIEWIRKFTSAAGKVAQAAKIQLEMIYVGKRNAWEKSKENITTIAKEKLSYTLPDPDRIGLFWNQLENIFLKKGEQGKSPKEDRPMHEIGGMLSFDNSNKGWAVISNESYKDDELLGMAIGQGDTILKCLDDYYYWKANGFAVEGFVSSLKMQIRKLHTSKHCIHMKLPMTSWSNSMMVTCMICGRTMKKFVTYDCCMP